MVHIGHWASQCVFLGVDVAVGMEVGGEDGVAVSKAVGVEVGVAVGVAVDVRGRLTDSGEENETESRVFV